MKVKKYFAKNTSNNTGEKHIIHFMGLLILKIGNTDNFKSQQKGINDFISVNLWKIR